MSRVMVIGDIMLDKYWHGSTDRISQEAPVPVVHFENAESRPGGAANVAMNIAGMGAECVLIGIAGMDLDEEEDILGGLLSDAGINHFIWSADSEHTITKIRVISQGQQLIRMDLEQPYKPNDDWIRKVYNKNIDSIDVLVIADYGKGTLTASLLEEIIINAKHKNIPVLVDPTGDDWDRYRNATLIKPNHVEFENSIYKKPYIAMANLNIDSLLVTHGAQGMNLHRNGQTTHIRSDAKEVFDVTGAGDTVIAALAVSMAEGHPIPEAAQFASVCAGIVVGKVGTATTTAYDLIKFADRMDIDKNMLVEVVCECHKNGEIVVFTNGCFDILHPGHIRLLEEAKKLGDRLIVAVNSDDSVRRLKGTGRPVNALAKRVELLAALKAVDWVIPFEANTPEDLIVQLSPDILVKGNDYRDKEIAGAKHVDMSGGKIVLIDMVDGESTTNLIEKINMG